MLNKTIAKIFAFVILVFLSVGLLLSCGNAKSNERERPDVDQVQSTYQEPKITGRIKSKDIVESSGLAGSKCQAGVFWTHNDSGDAAQIFAIDAAGNDLGTWKVNGAENRDWEDIAAFKDTSGQCFLYIGEIGNNEGKRDRTLIYRVKEPTIAGGVSSSGKNPLPTEKAESLSIDFPGIRPNSEALLVHPGTGDIYIVTKNLEPPASVFKITPRFGETAAVKAKKLGEITVPAILGGLLTGGDISADGRRLVLCDYVAGYELVLPDGAVNFDYIWNQKPVKFDIGDRRDGEAVTYSADGSSVFAISEGKNQPIFETRRR